MTRIGCYHAHYSNIEHIEQALASYEVELAHFVDPGLDRLKMDADFNPAMVEKKVLETLNWIAKCHVDAILITCTFFTAVFQEKNHPLPVPVIKIDDPLFRDICLTTDPVLFVFTNPNTVKGTMEQFNQYCLTAGKEMKAEARVLEHTFELIMQGKKAEYTTVVSKGLSEVAAEYPDARVIAAQLSMVPAARQAEQLTGRAIGHSLGSLVEFMTNTLSLQRKSEL